MNNKIALCLMVKNEEKNISRCIESVFDLIDNIYILDTGSTDQTVKIASQYTKNIYFKKFNNDYGYMRNYLLTQVKNEDWILFLDADECFTKENLKKLKKVIDELDEKQAGIRFYRYNFYSRGGWYTDHIVKMFRNKSFKYDKSVSEKIEKSILDSGFVIVEPNIILNHFGRSKPRELRDSTTHFYLDLMKKEIKKKEDGLMHAYVGINSMAIGDFNTALTEGKKSIEIDPLSIRSYYFYGMILRSLNRYEESINIFKKALNLNCGKMQASFFNMIGVSYISLEEFDIARYYLNRALKTNNALIHININLGLTYYFEKDFKTALVYFEKVAKENPAFLMRDYKSEFEYDPYATCSYETIHNYIGLDNYISICKFKIKS